MSDVPSTQSDVTQMTAPVSFRQIVGCVIMFVTPLIVASGKAGWGLQWELGYWIWLLIIASGCGIGGALMPWQEKAPGFGVGMWLGIVTFFLLQGYTWLRGQIAIVELFIAASILSGLMTRQAWWMFNRLMTPQGRELERQEIESLKQQASSAFEAAINGELRRRSEKYFEEAVDRELAQDKRNNIKTRTRRQVVADLEAEGFRTRLMDKLRVEVTREINERVENETAEMLARERKRDNSL